MKHRTQRIEPLTLDVTIKTSYMSQMRRMEEKHKSTVSSYEDHIMELTQRIDSLRHITEVLDEASRGKTGVKEAATSTSAEVSTQTDVAAAGRCRNLPNFMSTCLNNMINSRMRFPYKCA